MIRPNVKSKRLIYSQNHNSFSNSPQQTLISVLHQIGIKTKDFNSSGIRTLIHHLFPIFFLFLFYFSFKKKRSNKIQKSEKKRNKKKQKKFKKRETRRYGKPKKRKKQRKEASNLNMPHHQAASFNPNNNHASSPPL